MTSITGRPTDLRKNGACVEVKLWVPSHMNGELAYREQIIPSPLDAIATIDTGAHCTIIPHEAARRLGLSPVRTVQIFTASHHKFESCLYEIRLLFSNDIEVETLAQGAPWPVRADRAIYCCLGRDVLQHGILIYNGLTNTFHVIF